jgi:hypothetical protein
MIATTISSSINEKPFCFRISMFLSLRFAESQTAVAFSEEQPSPLSSRLAS